MKGPSGFERVPTTGLSGLLNPELVATPGAGWRICVTKVFITLAANASVSLEDNAGVPVVGWQAYLLSGRAARDSDDCTLFELAEDEPLMLGNAALATVRWNITYEIRPVGM